MGYVVFILLFFGYLVEDRVGYFMNITVYTGFEICFLYLLLNWIFLNVVFSIGFCGVSSSFLKLLVKCCFCFYYNNSCIFLVFNFGVGFY